MQRIPILIVDDDVELCSSLSRLLSFEGMDATCVPTAAEGLARAAREEHELVLLDVMLPDSNGRDVLRAIRMRSPIPVIMLTARGDTADRIAGLEGGADDYLAKPFEPLELVARIRAVLRRRGGSPVAGHFSHADLTIDVGNHVVLQSGSEVHLTTAEFDILLMLIRAAGRPVTREMIAEKILGRTIAPFDRSIDNHISNLRKKLGATVAGVERIRSIRGSGYCYMEGPHA